MPGLKRAIEEMNNGLLLETSSKKMRTMKNFLSNINFLPNSNAFTEDVLVRIFSYISDTGVWHFSNLMGVCRLWYFVCHKESTLIAAENLKTIALKRSELLMPRLRSTFLDPSFPFPSRIIWNESDKSVAKNYKYFTLQKWHG